MLFDEQVLKTTNVRILWGQFDRLTKRHHAVDGLFGFEERLVLLSALILEAKRLLKEGFHLADGIAPQDGNLETFFFKVLQRSRLTLLLRLQSEDNIGFLRCARD